MIAVQPSFLGPRSNSLTIALVVIATILALGGGCPAAEASNRADPRPVIPIDRDDIEISTSAILVVPETPVADENDDGVVRITGDDVHVTLRGTLCGATAEAVPDSFTGIGIVVTGKGVRLDGEAGAGVRGYRVGIEGRGCDGTTFADLDLSDNFAQRLGSTPQREDPADWLWPHANDAGEWAARYGASLRVLDARDVTVRDVRVRRSQNGIMLERVAGSRVFDNDCSFLSGWGLAMWRCSGNEVVRNAFDFCVRGYSHGIYNRGQDSAGILLFEQCTNNVFAWNSATHGGDGVFGFAGKEALGEVPPPVEFADDSARDAWYRGRGNTGNQFIGNDLSFAVAHGFEMTFSRGWRLQDNRLQGNGICGVWGGYSSDAVVIGNLFQDNGDMAYGREGGGINVEHGRGWTLVENVFEGGTEGFEAWWDEDDALFRTPWARANGVESAGHRLRGDRFRAVGTAISLDATTDVQATGIEVERVERVLSARNGSEARAFVRGDTPPNASSSDPSSTAIVARDGGRGALLPARLDLDARPTPLPGTSEPVGARAHLHGRARIVLTEWGPYDWESPLLLPESRHATGDVWRLLGETDLAVARVEPEASFDLQRRDRRIVVSLRDSIGNAQIARATTVTPYELIVTLDDGSERRGRGTLGQPTWTIEAFAWSADPREAPDAFDGEPAAIRWTTRGLDLRFGARGPTDLAPRAARLTEDLLPGADRFGIRARSLVTLPAGEWTIRITSDDGVRVRADGVVLFEDWTWHPPRHAAIELVSTGEPIELEVDHFELDGHAELVVELAPGDS